MSISSLLSNYLSDHRPILAEGSVYELLRRSPDVQFDPQLAHAALVFDPAARHVLESTHRAYCDVAARHQLPILTFTDTWRANPERIARSPLAGQPVNRTNAELLCGIRNGYGRERPAVFVAGLTGCRGDAYRPQEALATEAAIEFHREQITELSSVDIDCLFAATLPALSEAKGIGIIMAETECPYILSFVIAPHGTLLDGSTIDQAVAEIDSAVRRPPLGYFLNCVHPTVVAQALDSGQAESLRTRFIGFQANTSALDPAELDGIEQLQTEPPGPFAHHVTQIGKQCGMSILGGCCGTDTTHIQCMAQLILDSGGQ